jgi:hypothetical protein
MAYYFNNLNITKQYYTQMKALVLVNIIQVKNSVNKANLKNSMRDFCPGDSSKTPKSSEFLKCRSTSATYSLKCSP